VLKPQGLIPFALNDGKMLWLAMLTRDTGIPASKRLQIKDEVAALDFDLAVTYRLFLLRIEEQKAAARRIAYEVSRIFGGGSDDDDDVLSASSIDRYADETTQYW
jgi:hypothetical protein